MKTRVLIVDDSNFMRKMIGDVLSKQEGVEIVGTAGNGEDALDMALELKPDLITLDNILPDINGIDILKTLKKNIPDIKVIMISAVGQQSVINEAMEIGAIDYLVKPFDEPAFLSAFHTATN